MFSIARICSTLACRAVSTQTSNKIKSNQLKSTQTQTPMQARKRTQKQTQTQTPMHKHANACKPTQGNATQGKARQRNARQRKATQDNARQRKAKQNTWVVDWHGHVVACGNGNDISASTQVGQTGRAGSAPLEKNHRSINS
jgi:hypothetical protein